MRHIQLSNKTSLKGIAQLSPSEQPAPPSAGLFCICILDIHWPQGLSRLQSRRRCDFNLDPALTRPLPALQQVIKEVHHGGRHIALYVSENLGCAIVGVNGAYRENQKEQPRPEWFARSLFNFPVVGNAHRYLFDLHSTAVGARLSTRGIGGFLKETKDVAALPAAYHEFTRVCGRPLGAKATGHLIHPEIQVSAAFLIHFRGLGKSAVAASGTFQLAGVSIS